MNTLGERIKEARASIPGLSQAELARRVGVTPQGMSQLENGKIGDPAAYLLLGIARQTGHRLEWLLEGRGPRKLNQSTQLPGEDALLSAFRLAGDRQREVIRQVAELAAEQHAPADVLSDPMRTCMELVAAALLAEKKKRVEPALFFRMMESARTLLEKDVSDDREAILASIRGIAGEASHGLARNRVSTTDDGG